MDGGSTGSRRIGPIGGTTALARVSGSPRVTEIAGIDAVAPSGSSPGSYNDQPPQRDQHDSREESHGEAFAIAADTQRLLLETSGDGDWTISPDALPRLYGELRDASATSGPASAPTSSRYDPHAQAHVARQLGSRAYARDEADRTSDGEFLSRTV